MKRIILSLIFVIFAFSKISVFATKLQQRNNISWANEPSNDSSWSIDDASTYDQVKSVQPSPDGKYVLIEKFLPYIDTTKPQPSEILLYNNETKKLVWKTQSNWICFNPRWSPDGKNISFLRGDKEGISTFFITSSYNYDPIQIAQGKWNFIDHYWSPDSKKIAFLNAEDSFVEGNDDYSITKTLKNKVLIYVLVPNFSSKNNVSSKFTSFQDGAFSDKYVKPNTIISWHPNSQLIAFVGVNSTNNTEGIFILNTTDGRSGLIEYGGNPDFPVFSPDGELLAFVANMEKNSSLKKEFPTQKRYVFFKKLDEEGPHKLASTFDEQPTLIGWYPDSKHLLMSEGYKTIRRLYKLPITGEAPKTLNTSMEGLLSTISLSPSGKDIGFLSESLEVAPRPFTSSLENFSPQQVTQNFIQAVPLKSEVIQWKSFDGKEIEGILIYPSSYEEGKSYPLVVAAHDGPYQAWGKKFMGGCYNDMPFSPAVLSSQGYTVFLPNVRGSSNYGIDFARANQKDLGGGDFKDLMSGVDYLIERGIADPDKLAIWGWGYGGYLATWATTQTKRFKVAIVGAGITDLISFSGTGKKGFLEGYLGGPFWKNKKLWFSRSPIMNAENINTPTFFQYGINDKIFPITQGEEWTIILKKRSIPVKLVVFDQESHYFSLLPLSRKIGLTTLLEWINQYIAPSSANKKNKK